MKPVRDEVMTEGNMQGTKVYVSLDEASQPHLMSMFTDLYTNRIQATCREYMANALDSHSAAGQTRPIEVFTPTALRPTFQVKDWGVGLDKQDIIEVVSKYGASTKRDTDTQDGCLGLGCKSALTYATQFTYTGIKNGIKTIVLTSRDEDNRISMTVLDPIETDEPNGVEVSVPVQPGDAEKFVKECIEIMKHWPEGMALLNGKEVPKIKRDQEINDNLFLVNNQSTNKHLRYNNYSDGKMIVVMGNIPYPITQTQYATAMTDRRWQLPHYHSLVAHVPMGSVHFQPSREGLRDTSLTMKTLKQIAQTYEEEIVASMERDMAACKNRPAAMKKAFSYQRKFSGFPMPKYRGQHIPTQFQYEGKMLSVNKLYYYLTNFAASCPQEQYAYSYGRKDGDKYDARYDGTHNGVYVNNFSIEKWTRRHADKLMALLDDRGLLPEKVGSDGQTTDEWAEFLQRPLVIFSNMPDEFKEWCLSEWIVEFEDIREYKLPLSERSEENKRGKYEGIYEDAYMHEASGETLVEIEKEGKLYHVQTRKARHLSDYYTVVDDNNLHIRHYKALMMTLAPGATIICVPSNRIKKYERTFPNSIPMLNFVDKEFKSLKKTIGKRIMGYMTISKQDTASNVRAVPANKIHDPELRAVVKLLNDPQVVKKAATLVQTRELFGNINMHMTAELYDAAIEKRYGTLMTKYPVLAKVSTTSNEVRNHLAIYVNAVYNGGKE